MDFKIEPVETRLLSTKIKDALLTLIQQNCKDDAPFKLPNEDALANILGVTRASLRDVLIYLEQEGYVTRRRGIGTIVNPQVVNCTSRLDLEMDFSSIIQNEGYTPSFRMLHVSFATGSCPELAGEEEHLNLHKIFYADQTPVIYCQDKLRSTIFPAEARSHIQELSTTSFFDFLDHYTGQLRAYVLSKIEAALPSPEVATHLDISTNVPILKMSDIIYNMDHLPICYSDIYVRSGVLNFKFLRRTL